LPARRGGMVMIFTNKEQSTLRPIAIVQAQETPNGNSTIFKKNPLHPISDSPICFFLTLV